MGWSFEDIVELARTGNAAACFHLGDYYLGSGRNGDATHWFRRSRELGYFKGQALPIPPDVQPAAFPGHHVESDLAADHVDQELGSNVDMDPVSPEHTAPPTTLVSAQPPSEEITSTHVKAVISRTPGLSQSKAPLVTRILECGISEEQLKRVVQAIGVANKVTAVLETFMSGMSDNDIFQISRNYSREQEFLRSIDELENFRNKLQGEYLVSISYKNAKLLLDEFGSEGVYTRLYDLGGGWMAVEKMMYAVHMASREGHSVDTYLFSR